MNNGFARGQGLIGHPLSVDAIPFKFNITTCSMLTCRDTQYPDEMSVSLLEIGANVSLSHRDTHFRPQKYVSQKRKALSRNRTLHRHIQNGLKVCVAHNGSNSRSARRAHTGELPAADPSCRCRTSYIPAAMLTRTVPRPTTFPVSKLAICASPTEYTASVGYRSSAPGG